MGSLSNVETEVWVRAAQPGAGKRPVLAMGKWEKLFSFKEIYGNLYEFMRISWILCFFWGFDDVFNGDFIQIQWDLKDV